MSIFSSARWIHSDHKGTAKTSGPSPYFRKSFSISKPVKSAKLHITALGLYEAEINGAVIGDHVFAPGWTDYNKRVQYQTYDVTKFLKRGENALGAVLGDGWYSGHVGWWERQMLYGDTPKLMARLEIVFSDGSKLEVVTDGSWKTATGPIVENDIMTGEMYDARLELGAWSKGGYNEREWHAVKLAPAQKIELDPQLGPPVRRTGKVKVVSSKEIGGWPKPGFLYDLGQNFSGRVRIRVKATRGTKLKIRYAEVLEHGNLYVANLRAAKCTDYYICKGGGIEEWEPRFTYHGFRHVEITGLNPGDSIVEVTGIVLNSDTPMTGKFACSHPLLNQLQHNTIWGQKSNFVEVPTDCPQRDERLGWAGDAQVFVRTAAFNMDVRGFFHKWMRDVRDAQTKRGGIPSVAPANAIIHFAPEDGGPAWADAAIICPWTIYLCYNDKKILSENYDCMRRFIEFLGKDAIGLIRAHPESKGWRGYGDWLALDNGGKVNGRTPLEYIGTAFYAYSVGLFAKIAEILGNKADAVKYRKLHGRIVEAFRKRFVTPDGLTYSGTQTSYVLALHFDLLPEKSRALAAKMLADNIVAEGHHINTGFVATAYVPLVLERFGYLDLAYKLLEQETYPSWLFPIKNGATTIWERWDGWTPEKGFQDTGMNSFNHYAYGAVCAWIYSRVAGIELDPEKPGYKHIIFKPRPGGSLTWAEASLKTAFGETHIRWDKTRNGYKLDLTVPRGTRATLSPPEGYGRERRLMPGRHRIVLKPGKKGLPSGQKPSVVAKRGVGF